MPLTVRKVWIDISIENKNIKNSPETIKAFWGTNKKIVFKTPIRPFWINKKEIIIPFWTPKKMGRAYIIGVPYANSPSIYDATI
jgi:hypothetical protein